MKKILLRYRQIKAEMAMKGISLGALAKKAGVGYTTASLILCGRLNDSAKEKKLLAALEKMPMPKESPRAA